jgi:RNA polymerase sigma factor (sigma-70 family)
MDATGQEAFRILVARHGPMVLGLCRSVVKDSHEAEDAFQATFLVLLRKAESIRQRETIGPWLYGVAGRVARRARSRSVRRRKTEVAVVAEIPSLERTGSELVGAEPIVHQEIASLPESYRAPVVLCCLQGLSYDLAAQRLGVSEPALRGRLHRARRRLASRLRRRGVLAPVVARWIEPVGVSFPSLPEQLVESTIQFATRWFSVSGLLKSVAIPESITALAQGVIQAMLFQTVKLSGVGALLAAGVVGTVVWAQQGKNTVADPAGQTGEISKAYVQKPSADAVQKPIVPPTPSDLFRRTLQIQKKLDEVIAVDRSQVQDLEHLLKFIKHETTDATFPGIPIYVDPIGLQEAGCGMDTPVVEPTSRGRVREILHTALRLSKLDFRVQDGFLMISSRTEIMDRRLEVLEHKLDVVIQALNRIEHAPGGQGGIRH